MIGDPNWLYSTIAQSSAAIVAIVGGFITHSVLTLAAEKRSLNNQKEDKETSLQTRRNEEEKLSKKLAAAEVYNFLEDIFDELISSEELPSLEMMMQNHPETQKLNLKILKQGYERLYKRALEARNFIGQHLSKTDVMNFVTFGEWVKLNNLDTSAYDSEMLEKEYNRQAEQQASLLSENERLIRDTRRPSIIWPNTPHISSIWNYQELVSLRNKHNKVTDEISALENDVSDLKFRISNFSYPPHLRLAIYILTSFAWFSILLPVSLILKEEFSSIMKQVTFYFFMAGLVAVIFYIALLIKELRRK